MAHNPTTDVFAVSIPGHGLQHFSPAELSYRVLV